MQYIVYSVSDIVRCIWYIVYVILFTVYYILYMLYGKQYILYNKPYNVYCVTYTVYTILYTICCMRYAAILYVLSSICNMVQGIWYTGVCLFVIQALTGWLTLEISSHLKPAMRIAIVISLLYPNIRELCSLLNR